MKNPETQIETERKPHNPPCKFLRSKEMFYEDAAGEEGEFASDVFWCSKSQPSALTASRPTNVIATTPENATIRCRELIP